nr:hypothetical protein [Tanacetum cinerariifolium]
KSSDEDDDDDVDDQSDAVDDDDQEDEDEQDDDDQDSGNDDDEFIHPKLSTHDEEAKDEESFDPIVQTPSRVDDSDDDSNDDESHGMNVGGEEGPDVEDDDEELYRDVNINLEGIDSLFESTPRVDVPVTTTIVPLQSLSMSSQCVTSMFNPSPDAGIDSLFESTPRVDVPVTTTIVPLQVIAPTLAPPFIPIMSQVQQAPALTLITAPSTSLQDLQNFGSLFGFDHPQAENKDFINKLDENIQKIMKEQVKVQISKILPKIKRTVNEQLESEVLTRSSNSSKTSYAVTADLSEMELKKILIEKMESNKLKRHRNDADKDEETFDGSDRGSKRRREGKEPESTSAPKEKASKTIGKSTEGSKSHQKTASEFAPIEEPMQTTQDLEEPSHQEFKTGVADDQPITEASQHPKWFQKQTKPPTPNRAWSKTLPATHESIQPWISDLAKQANYRTLFNELMDTPMDFLAFLMNRVKVDTLTPELLAGPTCKLMKGSCKSLQYPHNLLKPLPLITNSRGHCVIPFDHFINNDLEYLRGGASSRKESARYVYSKRRIIAVTELQIVKWYDYKHLDWITMRKDDDKLYKFKEGDFKRLHIQDIKDMLLLPVQGKLTNLTVKERFAFNGIQIKYLPQTIWRRSDKERAAAMIQAIDKQLNTRRIMQSLEKFVGRRLYEGDFRMLQRTI